MLFPFSITGDRPIYTQITEQVTFVVAAGGVRPGDLIPSVRELSKQLLVNPNTVARAYRELQSLGVLETVRGTGLQVTEGALERCRAARHDIVRRKVRAAVEEAKRSELDPSEIEAILREEWGRANGVVHRKATGGDVDHEP